MTRSGHGAAVYWVTEMSELEALPVPEQISHAEQKVEIARLWVADGKQVIVLSPSVWSDPACWGLMLVDIAHHVAAVYEPLGYDRHNTLERIRAAFDAEWAHPTSETEELS